MLVTTPTFQLLAQVLAISLRQKEGRKVPCILALDSSYHIICSQLLSSCHNHERWWCWYLVVLGNWNGGREIWLLRNKHLTLPSQFLWFIRFLWFYATTQIYILLVSTGANICYTVNAASHSTINMGVEISSWNRLQLTLWHAHERKIIPRLSSVKWLYLLISRYCISIITMVQTVDLLVIESGEF